MKTEVVKINRLKPEAAKLKKVADVLKNGGIVVFPTDTVYGLACNAFNASARHAIYKLKGRAYNKPLIFMAANTHDLLCLFETPKHVSRLMKKFWPGPLTLVLPATDIGKIVMGGRNNLGARIPNDKAALELMSHCGFPLATTSANPSNKPSAKTFKDAFAYFNNKVDLIIDCGKCKTSHESTVLDVCHFPYTVIRRGCLKKSELLKECVF